MANILIQLTKTTTQLPAGVTFASTNLVVTDSGGATQSFSLNGSETPPWSVLVSGLADGNGSIVASDVDTTGATIGTPVSQSFNTGVATFAATTGITVTPA